MDGQKEPESENFQGWERSQAGGASAANAGHYAIIELDARSDPVLHQRERRKASGKICRLISCIKKGKRVVSIK